MPTPTDLPQGFDSPAHRTLIQHLLESEKEMFAALLNPDVTIKLNTKTGNVDVRDITRNSHSDERRELAQLHMMPKAQAYSPEGVYHLALNMALARRERDALWALLREQGLTDEEVFEKLKPAYQFDTNIPPVQAFTMEQRERGL